MCRRRVTFREPERRYHHRDVPSSQLLMARERDMDRVRRAVLLNRTQPMAVNITDHRTLEHNHFPRNDERRRELIEMERPEERYRGQGHGQDPRRVIYTLRH